MTTIAYSNGILAVDSLVTEHGGRVAYIDKHCETSRYLAAYCGDIGYLSPMLKWAKSNFRRNKPTGIPKNANFELVVVDREDGSVSIVGPSLKRVKLDNAQYCSGSGQSYAWGALAMGASAEKAVLIASTFDTSTGGTVKCLTR